MISKTKQKLTCKARALTDSTGTLFIGGAEGGYGEFEVELRVGLEALPAPLKLAGGGTLKLASRLTRLPPILVVCESPCILITTPFTVVAVRWP